MSIPPDTRTGYLPLGVYPATLDEIEARFATTAERKVLMKSLRRAVQQIAREGWAKRIYVVGCFIGPRIETNDVDLLVTVDPGALLQEREARTLELKLGVLRKALQPDVDLKAIDDDLPAVEEALKIFQRDKLAHGGYERGILELTEHA